MIPPQVQMDELDPGAARLLLARVEGDPVALRLLVRELARDEDGMLRALEHLMLGWVAAVGMKLREDGHPPERLSAAIQESLRWKVRQDR